MPACPEQSQLAYYLAGRLSAARETELAAHLRDCRTCQAAAAACLPASDSMLRAIRRSALVESDRASPELAAALHAVGLLASPETLPSGSDAAADTGRLIRDYELQKKLGEGGMGAVYLAMHTRLKKPVAIKLLKSDRTGDAGAIARFAVEMEAVGKLEHPHIVRALDAGEENGTHFLVMEYLPGIDLARLVRGLGRIELPDACELIRQAALGLHHAHDNEVVHRDVKPSNLMLLPSGKVKVLDLGLARYRPALGDSQGLTRDHQVLGTLLYVAPEQLAAGGAVDARADVFSLGVTLAELLLGRVPLRHGPAMPLSHEEMTARPEVPPDIWRLIERMTAVAPAQRPASMLEVAEALRPWTSGANLPALLMRFTGQSTFAAVPTPPSGQLTPGGQWLSQPGERLSGWTPIDVIPPPISTAVLQPAELAGPQSAGESDLPMRPWFSSTALWLSVSALAVAVAVLATIAATRRPDAPSITQTTGTQSAAPLASVELICDAPEFADVLDGLLKRGDVVAIHQETGKRHPVRFGPTDIPPGVYRLEGGNVECRLQPLTFIVAAPAIHRDSKTQESALQQIVVLPSFDFPFASWKYPQLPAAPQARAVYRGDLSVRLPGQPEPLTSEFLATLTILGDAPIGDRAGRWLEIDIFNEGIAYRETAVLHMDVEEWEANQTLRIETAWVQAQSAALTARLRASFGDDATPQLVTPLDRDRDRLVELADKLGCGLPVERISVQDALVLFFGDACQASQPWFRTVRAKAPPPSHWALGLEPGSPVTKPHLQVTAEEPGISLYLSRSESIPFGFDRITVSSPALSATLKLDRQSPSHDKAAPRLPDVAELARLNQIVMSLPARPQPFDVAAIPDKVGAGVTLSGAVEVPGLPLLDYTVELRALQRENVGDVPHRWIDISVLSGGHQERALLLVNEPEYSEHGRFVVDRGWFLCHDHVFPLDASVNLRDADEALHFLGTKALPPQRLGVHDVATLVFGASLGSPFDPVRRHFADYVTRNELKVKDEFVTGYSLRKAGVSVDAMRFELAGKGAAGGPSYTIYRSTQTPFEFVEVKLTTASGITLTASADSIWEREPTDDDREERLLARSLVTNEQVAAARAKKPNWRLWTLTDDKARPIRLWAEYGGSIGERIVVREMFGQLRVLPLDAIYGADDRAAIEAGRLWFDKEGKAMLRGEMLSWRAGSGTGKREPTVEMQDKAPGATTNPRYLLSRFQKDIDQAILQELMKLVPADAPPAPKPPTRPPRWPMRM
jgi:serine/threonine protein kinase